MNDVLTRQIDVYAEWDILAHIPVDIHRPWGYGSNVVVRPALLTDIDWLIVQLRAFSDFFSKEISLFPRDEGHARTQLGLLIQGHYCRIAEAQDNTAVLNPATGKTLGEPRAGFIAAMVSPHWFNPEVITATEIFWWVSPEHRLSRAGGLLLSDYIEWGKKTAHWIALGLEENSPIKDETLAKRGFRLKEKSYILETGPRFVPQCSPMMEEVS